MGGKRFIDVFEDALLVYVKRKWDPSAAWIDHWQQDEFSTQGMNGGKPRYRVFIRWRTLGGSSKTKTGEATFSGDLGDLMRAMVMEEYSRV